MSASSDAKRTVRKVTAGEAEIDPAAKVCAADEKKSKKQLLDEIIELRQRLNARTALDPVRQAIETELKGTRQRLQYLLAVSPAIIYTNKASGDFTCTFVSENLGEIMGYSPQEMDHQSEVLVGPSSPRGCPESLRGDEPSDRARRRNC